MMAIQQERYLKDVNSLCDLVKEKSVSLEMTLRQACHEDNDNYQLSLKKDQ